MATSKDFILNTKNPARFGATHASFLEVPLSIMGLKQMMALVLLEHLAFRGISSTQERINTLFF